MAASSFLQRVTRPKTLRLLGTLLAFGLLALVLGQQGWAEIGAALTHLAPWRLAAALGLMLLSRLLVTARWHVLLRAAGLKIPWRDSLRITFAGLFATNFLPTTVGGDVVRLAGAIRLGQDPAISTASLLMDRLVGMTGMALALPFGLPRFLATQTGRGALPVSAAGALAGRLPQAARRGWTRLVDLAGRTLRAVGLWLHQPRGLLLSLLLTLLHMLCFFTIFWLLLGGMGAPLPLLLIGGLYSLVYFVTLLPFSINGYGLQELTMTLVFANVGGASVSASLTTALIFRTLMMLASLPGAIFVPALLAPDPADLPAAE